ncbi:aspartate--tRNA(Asn) ligase [bacterium (Candidatus Gribaldobacteria) CG10_big_fil_rev_8_21_14_0_10_37_21]|uniref:Aspartate--tRNA ligase n=2 Tax=Candidatus Gribaldobacteria TaxID=2798536 RepID=A0A2H0UUL7_9BACT|nr:MAG: aspartate--tRNA(Asn) ligase [Parcubacteria group bacterium CG1_02_37_13]PIR90507.1 MAG: aspartate--tRNA(Asn) ligase [bacterium (Candidatus Gribaldobacteria) CG10_big_fil_rev_8_21_14_0_10_37_21]
MKRILNTETIKCIGKSVIIKGWVDTVRAHGSIVFFDLRDRTGLLQAVAGGEIAKALKEEDVVELQGEIVERPEKMQNKDLLTGQVELQVKEIKVLSKAQELPFAIKEGMKLSLPVLLDFRPLTLRNEKIKAIFKIEEKAILAFRQTMEKLDFTEVQAPTIVPTATEGGSEVFKIDYYGKPAFLGQSPQLYKQIMVSVFERVYMLAHAYRAEPSVTTRHLSEYISLDAEMGFIESWEELMDTCEVMLKNVFSAIEKDCSKELELFEVSVPKIKKIPRLKLKKAQQIILERTKRDNTNEPDLSPEDEVEICKWSFETHKSELVFITHYPTKKRPFYTMPDKDNPEETLSFDVLYKGLEIITGGQRINDYEQLLSNVKKWGNDPSDFEIYLQAFKYGMPPEGGFALGAERIIKQLLNLENLREASLFPRDMSRIDKRLNV